MAFRTLPWLKRPDLRYQREPQVPGNGGQIPHDVLTVLIEAFDLCMVRIARLTGGAQVHMNGHIAGQSGWE